MTHLTHPILVTHSTHWPMTHWPIVSSGSVYDQWWLRGQLHSAKHMPSSAHSAFVTWLGALNKCVVHLHLHLHLMWCKKKFIRLLKSQVTYRTIKVQVIRNTAHRPSTQASYTIGSGTTMQENQQAAQIAAKHRIIPQMAPYMSWIFLWFQ